MLKAHELQNSIENIILRRLRNLRISSPKRVAEELSMDIMRDCIPPQSFDASCAWERGLLFFHGEVTEEYVREMQEEIAFTHCNIPRDLPIVIYLSSIGGSWEAGLALFSTIQEVRRAGRKVVCHIQGVAMSMGSILAQACDERVIEPHATVMIHEAYDYGGGGKIGEIEDSLVYHRRIDASICAIYSSRSDKPASYWREKMSRRDWYMTAMEAVKEGLMDRVKPIPPFQKRRSRKQRVSPDA